MNKYKKIFLKSIISRDDIIKSMLDNPQPLRINIRDYKDISDRNRAINEKYNNNLPIQRFENFLFLDKKKYKDDKNE